MDEVTLVIYGLAFLVAGYVVWDFVAQYRKYLEYKAELAAFHAARLQSRQQAADRSKQKREQRYEQFEETRRRLLGQQAPAPATNDVPELAATASEPAAQARMEKAVGAT
ncbi:hypothetical protein Pan216_51360 [Planctomycetes bacterium Pan216]|uniref:Uncharacterized protein n=1 Tax=Kolteria novifilia TaxID=2527975 RepID=A0A518BBB6_9BACT|nr:hypothetical protein Pan216_51360 [Planctomycetes bacterium Pan216]